MTDTHPEVSIVVPVYNAAAYLGDLLRLLDQVLENSSELVFLDDGSVDGSLELLEAFARTRANVQVARSASNGGVANARNTALKMARGTYVWFADSDDYWDPEILQTLKAAIRNSNADIAMCVAEVVHAPGTRGTVVDGVERSGVWTQSEAIEQMLSGKMHGYLWNKLFRREVLGENPFTNLTSQSDFTGVIHALGRSSAVAYIPDHLYFHVVRSESITTSKTPKMVNLLSCVALMEDLVRNKGKTALENGMWDYFRAWFLIVPLADTPLRVGASSPAIFDGIKLARSHLRSLPIAGLRQRDRSLWIRLRLIRDSGPFYPHVYSFVRSLKRKQYSRS